MELSRDQIEQILNKSIWSPSGDNTQPWHFEWNGESLKIRRDAVRAQHPLDPHGAASMIALGCLVENIEISASQFQLEVSARYFDFSEENLALWAEIRFAARSEAKNPLFEQIPKRVTDRRLYRGGELEISMLQKTEFETARVHINTELPDELVNYIVQCEQLMASHPHILPETMKWVRFTLKDAKARRDGMFWKNLGARIWEVPTMPLMRDHPLVFKMVKSSIGAQHRKRVSEQLSSSAGIVCVSAHPEPLGIVSAGRLMQNTWLSLTAQGFQAQPLTLASTVPLCVKKGWMSLPQNWVKFYQDNERCLAKHFSIPKGSTAIWMLRTGLSSEMPENSRTFRRHLGEVLKFT